MLPRPAVAAVARLLLVAAPLSLLGGGCATNPATGKPQLSFFGEEAELNMGRDADAEIVATVGLYDDDELADYVEDVGHRLAAASERPYLPWSFKVLDDPGVNAFALPGGYVYVTRGILAELASEAELAAVLGHEIGHVTARHSVHAASQQILATIGVGVAAVVLDPDHADDWFDVGTLGLAVLFLAHSRADERQADDLGLRYLMRAGYDPTQMPEMFSMLEQVGEAEGGGRLPAWLSTHPDPGKRRLRISEQVTAAQARGEGPTAPLIERDAYLRHLDGLAYGANPRQGVLRDGEALHPALGIRVAAPEGWKLAGTPKGLTLRQPEGGGALAVEVSEQETVEAADARFFGGEGVERGKQWDGDGESLTRWSRFTAKRKEGEVAGTVVFAESDGRVFELVAMAPAAKWDGLRVDLEDALATFEASAGDLGVAADRLEIVEVPEALALADFATRWPSTVPLENLALLNRIAKDGTLAADSLAKRVVAGGARPASR
jgi:predicted Zn-dependent protease